MHLGLDKRLVLVTGSTQGIGYGIAEMFVREGAHVILNARNAVNLEEVKEKINANAFSGKVVAVVAADISTRDGSEKCIAEVKALGDLDILVCNIGIFEVKEFEDITDDDWEKYFQTNIMTTVRMCRAFLKPMIERNSGRILIISSECAYKTLPHMIHYSMTKTAQVSLARSLAERTKGTGVTVNSVLPGPTNTEGLQNYFAGLAKETNQPLEDTIRDYFKTYEPTSLIQRPIEVEEVAAVVAFLASDLASAINGNAQRVEGGVIRSI